MKWQKLVDSEDENLWRGTVFRFPAVHPFEAVVDFMLFEDASSESGFSLVCTTGYKSGLHEGELPLEARALGNVFAISRSWLVENWTQSIYRETPASEVRFTDGYSQEIGSIGGQET